MKSQSLFSFLFFLGIISGFPMRGSAATANEASRLKYQERQKIISTVQRIYRQNLSEKAQVFSIVVDPLETTESGSAEFDGQNYIVHVTDALLRSTRMSDDGFRMVLCHEIGHHFGGAPRKNAPMEWNGPLAASDNRTYSSSEGEADFYASRTCFAKVVEGEDHETVLHGVEISPSVKKACEQNFTSSQDVHLCIRAALAGENFLKISADAPISFDQKESFITNRLLRDLYPTRQCRLDTFLAGAKCPDRGPLLYDFNDAARNDCPTVTAQRPACWYIDSQGL